MSSVAERLAAELSPPVTGGVYAASSTSAVAAVDLWADLANPYDTTKIVKYYARNRFLTIQAEGQDVYVVFSSANSTAIDPATNPGNWTGATNCVRIPAGTERTFLVGGSPATRYLVHRTAATAGVLRMWASSPKTSEEN